MVWIENMLRKINKITLKESNTIEAKFVIMDIWQLQQKLFQFPFLWLWKQLLAPTLVWP